MLSNIKVGTKLLAGFLLVSVVTLVVGLVGYRGMGGIMAAYDDAADVRMPAATALLTIQEAVTAIKSAERTLLVPTLSLEEKVHEYGNFGKRRGHAEEFLRKYEEIPRGAEEERLWTVVQPAWTSTRSVYVPGRKTSPSWPSCTKSATCPSRTISFAPFLRAAEAKACVNA